VSPRARVNVKQELLTRVRAYVEKLQDRGRRDVSRRGGQGGRPELRPRSQSMLFWFACYAPPTIPLSFGLPRRRISANQKPLARVKIITKDITAHGRGQPSRARVRPLRKTPRRGRVPALDSEGQTIWIVDAHRDDGRRFVVRSDEKLTAFMELESAVKLD
jgi:hypothetical protein